MKPHLHIKYIKEVFNQIENIDDEQREELLVGSITNDLCEFTEEFSRIYTEKGLVEDTIGKYSALYQSHFGKLSALHAMANEELEPIKTTKSHICNWLNFLETIAINNNIDDTYLSQKMSSFHDNFGEIVKNMKFRFSDIIDTNDIEEARTRSIGMIIHIIQDSYTISHCKRTLDNGEIEMFYNYKSQKSSEHKACDNVHDKHKEMMIKNMKNILSLLLERKPASHLYPEIFKISNESSCSKSIGFHCDKVKNNTV